MDVHRDLMELFRSRADERKDEPCVTHLESGRTLSYAEIWQKTLQFIKYLKDAGVKPKDRVVFAVRNHWAVLPLLAACSAHRAVLCPVDPELHRDELAKILSDVNPALFIAKGPSSITVSGATVISLPKILEALEAQDLSEYGEASWSIDRTDNTLMIYTSGTTGGSKWVMLSSQNLIANAASLVSRYKVTNQDRFFCFLPTHHMNALMMTGMVPLTAGASLVLSDVLSVKNAKNFWQNLADHKITIASLVPSIMALLIKLFPAGKKVETPLLRLGFCGAAPLTAELWQQFEQHFHVPLHQGYGLTETTCWAVSSLLEGDRHYNSVGVPLDCEVHIEPFEETDTLMLGKDQNAEVLQSAASGEVWIRGAIVTSGYFRNPKLNKESLTRDGFFRTGDIGLFDTDGYLHITGRIKEIIIKNGANVFSRDLDRVLAEHPAIRESKTIGMPDELVGERIYCICVLREGSQATSMEIKAWLQSRISQHMWPDAIVFMGCLPHGAAGKVTTNVIRKIIGGQLVDEILQSLNSWRYKRAQPSDSEGMKKKIQANLIAGEPVHFLAYWGCGARDHTIEQDTQTLLRLKEFVDGVRKAPQIRPRLTLIFTDTHARNNRIPDERMNRYFSGIREEAEKLGLDTIRLSELWQQAGLDWQSIVDVMRSETFQKRWADEPLRLRLVDQAAKHAEQGFEPSHAAEHYYAACLHEAVEVAKIFPKALFTTFNHPDFDCISPNLEKLYLTSFKEGTSVKPWFYESK